MREMERERTLEHYKLPDIILKLMSLPSIMSIALYTQNYI